MQGPMWACNYKQGGEIGFVHFQQRCHSYSEGLAPANQ